MSSRPRLLYFNGPWNYLGERMIQSYIEPFRRLLEQDFEVISVEGNRDFRQEVETHRPDMVLFHTGCEAPGEPEVTITNTDAFPGIPRMGYMFRDPFSPSRMATMNRMRTWRVDQVITDFRPTDTPAPYFKDTMYLPWWIDDRLFRDYGETKSLCVTLTGSGWLSQCIYKWRKEICLQLLPRFPIFHAPSLGNRQNNHDYTGERYARLLNRSQFSAGCGTINRYLTMKLLEIPAARCCLVTEEIEVLKAIGFKDGVNCIFADAQNVAAKVQALLDDPARLQSITDAGYSLVHQHHTQRNRRIFSDWYRLWQSKGPDQRVVQVNPLEPLQIIAGDSPVPSTTFPRENPVADALTEGYRLLAASRWNDALVKFDWVLAIIPCVAEARLGAALCLMRLGRLADATPHLRYNLNLMVGHFGYVHPDPIDMAFIGVLCLRMKDANSAVNMLGKYTQVRHPALNAMRWILAQTIPGIASQPVFKIQEGDETTNVETVHLLPQQTFADWAALLMAHLRTPVPSAKSATPNKIPALASN